MSKPSILIVPGSFALPYIYDEVIAAVAAKGYEIRAIHIPSIGLSAGKGREGPLPSMYDDAAFIANEVEKLADGGKDVVLVGHSYGGVPVTESTKSLGKQERLQNGKTGGIVRIAYMTCLTPALGASAISMLAGVPKEQSIEMKIDVCSHSLVSLVHFSS